MKGRLFNAILTAWAIVTVLEIQCFHCWPEITGHPVVTTKYGQLRGSRVSTGDGFYVDRFLNIPYAKPPKGGLRFRRPEPPEGWTGVRDATQYGAQCPQAEWPSAIPLAVTFPNEEDCLYLNIFTPELSQGVSRLPVMFWIHGGGLYLGTGNSYDGTELATKGVVIVTINYRLDSLGFLSTEDAASPGNYGLWDMIRALEWTRDSISAFNGKPDDVTIFGESAGGVSVSLLLDSAAAGGLFHKAIMQSGVSIAPHAIGHPGHDPRPKNQAIVLGQQLSCDTSDTERLTDCLRTKDVDAIIAASTAIRNANFGQSTFRPVVESTFGQLGVLSAVPLSTLKSGHFANISTIRGFTKDESALAVSDPDNDGFSLDEFKTLTQNFVRQYFTQSSYTVDLNSIYSTLLEVYLYGPHITDPFQLRAAFIQMLSDYGIVAPTVREIKLATTTGKPVPAQYLYRFSYRSQNSLTPQWQGVPHMDDILYTFGSPVTNISMVKNSPDWTDADKEVSQQVMTMWTNFAKFGIPTPYESEGVHWLSLTWASHVFLDITHQPHMRDDLITPQLRFWIETFPQMLGANSTATLVG